MEGNALLEAGKSIIQRSRVVELQAGEVFRLYGPGGTITLHDGGITLEGIAIALKGPMRVQPGGSGHALSWTASR